LDNLLASYRFNGSGGDLTDCFRVGFYSRSYYFSFVRFGRNFFAIKEWLRQWITEIAVTDRRVIVKTGLIRRHTAEMNMDKVESVTVYQSVLGRLLDYGSVHVRGTGEGLGHLDYISSPILLRNTITAK
jgi:hypothetical protein